MEDEHTYFCYFPRNWSDALAVQANLTRGLVAAACCAAVFILYGVVQRVLGSRSRSLALSTITSTYNKETGATLHGLDNPALEKKE